MSKTAVRKVGLSFLAPASGNGGDDTVRSEVKGLEGPWYLVNLTKSELLLFYSPELSPRMLL